MCLAKTRQRLLTLARQGLSQEPFPWLRGSNEKPTIPPALQQALRCFTANEAIHKNLGNPRRSYRALVCLSLLGLSLNQGFLQLPESLITREKRPTILSDPRCTTHHRDNRESLEPSLAAKRGSLPIAPTVKMAIGAPTGLQATAESKPLYKGSPLTISQ